MSEIDWSRVKYFNPAVDKFSEDPDLYADPQLIYDLDKYRSMIGVPVFPSPAPGALARFTGSITSQHYAVDRKCTAIDVFPSKYIRYAWLTAVTCGLWGGVGLYPFTKFKGRTMPMLHLDTHPIGESGPLCWVRLNDNSYVFNKSETDTGVIIRNLSLLVG